MSKIFTPGGLLMVFMLSATSILPNVAAANGNAANGKKYSIRT